VTNADLLKTALRAWKRERLPGGRASGMHPSSFDRRALARGTRVEMEHTRDPATALEIATDHLQEDPHYYAKLATIHGAARPDLPAFRLTRPGEPVPYVDRFTVGHGMIGFLSGLARLPWWASLGLAIGWEIVENPIKRAAPQLFPVGISDTLENAALDVVAWMAGYGVARMLPPARR